MVRIFPSTSKPAAPLSNSAPPTPGGAGRALRRAKRIDDWDQAAALVKLIADNSNRRLAADDEGPTPETIVHHRRRRGDTIETLVANRKLQWHQQAAAMQIATIYESLTAPLWARGGHLEQGRIDGANGSGGIPERHAALYHRKFLPWARWMTDPRSLFQSCEACGRLYTIPRRLNACECGGRLWRASPHLGLVLSIAVFGTGVQHCADAYRMHRRRTLRLLALGLDRYADFA